MPTTLSLMDLEKKDLETDNSHEENFENEPSSEGNENRETVSLDEYRSKLKAMQEQLAERDNQVKRLEKQISEWEQKLVDIREYVKRMEAETAAVRERSRKEVDNQVLQRMSRFLPGFLNIMDNLERSLKADVDTKNIESFVQGVHLIHKQMEEVLKENGVEKIPAVGETFDPHLHEAVTTQPVEDDRDEQILEELRTGYRIRDFILRPSQVVVGKKM